jgi:sirohydrochlorin cobaltochelatase
VPGPIGVLAVGGHESANGRALTIPGVRPTACGRELYRAVHERVRAGYERICVVPMTLGRDAELIADTARTLAALGPAERARVVLTAPFGTARHLTGWLRAAANRMPSDAALLVTAPAGDVYDDAELYRIARLVRQYGRHTLVEVALADGDPDLAHGVERCRALGAHRVVVLPASFVVPSTARIDCVPATALLTPSAVAEVVAARVAAAVEHVRAYGDDGVAAGLVAAADHGTGHSHAAAAGHDHGSGGRHPDHGDEPAHEHTRAHAHAHGLASADSRPASAPSLHFPVS